MWLSSLEVRGLSEEVHCRWERVGTLAPSGPVADALALLVAALRPERAPAIAEWLGWGLCTVDEREVAIGRPSAVRRVLQPGPRPQITIEIVVEPDPPMFGRLRDAVLRDPQLAGGLGEGTLTLRVGWLFTPDLAFASLDLLGVALGEVPVALNDRPAWLERLLADVGGRIGFVDWRFPVADVAESLAASLFAPDPELRAAAQRALVVAAEAPLFTPLEIVQEGEALFAIGESLAPLHWSGPEAETIARLVHAVFVVRPDVLVVRSPLSDAVRAWVEAQLEGDSATLEQVLLA